MPCPNNFATSCVETHMQARTHTHTHTQLTNAIQGKKRKVRPPFLGMLPLAADREEPNTGVHFRISEPA